MTEHKSSTMLDLASKIDAAIRDEAARQKAVDAARIALDTATQQHTDAVTALTKLHGEYQAFMDNVLTLGGTVHVAKP